MARKIEVEIVGNSRSLERAMGRAGSASKGLGRDLHALGRTAKLAIGVGVGAGIVGLGLALHSSVKEFEQAQKATAQTRAVIKSTGGVANISARQVESLSNALLKKTGIDDEVIQGGENMLLTFRNIRNEVGKGNDIFTQATKAGLDMSTAMQGAGFEGGSLKTTMIRLGKALNDPVQGMTALRRVGVTFSKAQQAVIKHLEATGQHLKAQKLILRELNAEFGGSAEAFGKTLPGQLTIFREKLRNVGAYIVGKAIPIFSQAIDVVSRFGGFLGRIAHAPNINIGLKIAGKGVGEFAATMKEAFSRVLFGWKDAVRAGGPVIDEGTLTFTQRFHKGLLQQFQSLDWGMIGRQVGVGISSGLTLTDASVSRMVGVIRAHAQDFAELGAEIAARMAATLFDIGFWAHHWRLALALGLTIFGRGIAGEFGRLGGVAVTAFRARFIGRIAGVAAGLVTLFDRVVPSGVARVAGVAAGILARVFKSGIDQIGRVLSRVPPWIQAAFKVGAVIAFIGVVQKAANKVKDVYNWLKKVGRNFAATISVHVNLPGGKAGRVLDAILGGAQNLGAGLTGGVIHHRAAGGTIPMLPNAVRGRDSVAALLTPGEIVLNRAQQEVLGGPRYLQDLFGFERFASGGTAGKPKHKPPKLPWRIKNAEERAKGTETYRDDIAAYQQEVAWTNRELRRGDLTSDERGKLRNERTKAKNKIAGFRQKAANRKQKDYSQLPAAIQKRINKARYENDNVALLAALKAGKNWLLRQLNRKGLTNQQQSDIYAALDSIDDEIQSVQDEINAPADQTPTPDQIAQGQQAYDQGFAAGRGQAFDAAFVATGVFAGGGGGGAPGTPQGPAGPAFGFYEYHPLESSPHLARATNAIVTGMGRQNFRQATRQNLGV